MFVKIDSVVLNMNHVAWFQTQGASIMFYIDAHRQPVTCWFSSEKQAEAAAAKITQALSEGIEDLVSCDDQPSTKENEEERKATEKLDKDLTRILDDLFSNLDKDIQDICRKHGLDK